MKIQKKNCTYSFCFFFFFVGNYTPIPFIFLRFNTDNFAIFNTLKIYKYLKFFTNIHTKNLIEFFFSRLIKNSINIKKKTLYNCRRGQNNNE